MDMWKVFWGVLLALLAYTAIMEGLFFLGVLGVASAVNRVVEQNGRQAWAEQAGQL